MSGASIPMPVSPEPGAIDSRRLEVFLSAAQTESFAAAADRLSLTPSAVSHAIKTLEEEFDCNLFKRHGPRVKLTRAGIRLMPLAEELLSRMAQLRKEVAVIKGNPRSLRVMMPEPFCSLMLPKVLPDFMECFPRAFFEVVPRDEDEEQSTRRLLTGELDLLLDYSSKGNADVVRRDLYRESLRFYAAPFHALAHREALEPATFEQHPLLVPDASSLQLVMDRIFKGQPMRSRIWQMPSTESARELARVGQAIALLPEHLASKHVAQGHLISLTVSAPPLDRTCSAHWSARAELSWAAEVFVSLVELVAQEDESGL
jgi:DNA-binding transcriptional LysR family regulator